VGDQNDTGERVETQERQVENNPRRENEKRREKIWQVRADTTRQAEEIKKQNET